jgi:hypothetical protein
MCGDHKHGNGWYYGESEVIRKDKGTRAHVRAIRLEERTCQGDFRLEEQRQALDEKTAEDSTVDAADETKLTLSRRDIEKTHCFLQTYALYTGCVSGK